MTVSMPQIDYMALWNTWGIPALLALAIIIVAHFAAKAVKWAIARAVDRIPFFPRKEIFTGTGPRPPTKVGERLGEVGYWLVWLIGLIAALSVLRLQAVVDPLNRMVNGFVEYVPEVVGAGIIFFVGFVLATIVRRTVEAAVQAMELDQRLIDAGLTHTPKGPGLSRLLGILVFTLIIIPVSIAALDVLDIRAISDPATAMLNSILTTIPRVIGAALIVFIAYLIGRWIATLTEAGLNSIGFDEAISSLGATEPVRMGVQKSDPTPGVDSLKFAGGFPPSRMVGLAVLVGIVLFASVEAARLLGFGAMAAMLSEILELASRVLTGAVIIALGVLLANILAAATVRADNASSEIMSVLVRWGVIFLAAAVGLRFMGLANDIIVLAFGLVLGAVAVATAIAFGVGGRDAAKRMLDRWTATK